MPILDTQLLIWATNEPERLPPVLSEHLRFDRDFYFSLASLWEVSIKASLGKPSFKIDVNDFYVELLKLGFSELPIGMKHIQAVSQLPWLHKDPFDRLLVATAKVESSSNNQRILLTADTTLKAYGVFVEMAR
jgi:PIN domain nuclease of toxin-antitoxin system